jgi:DNA-binding transcriptional ArsR family regulator
MRQDDLSRKFALFAPPVDLTRRAILARLPSGETSLRQLAKPFQMSLPAVLKHLKVLERGGFEACGRDAQWRPCWLETDPLRDAAECLQEYRPFWEESLDRLNDYLRELQRRENKHGRSK